MSSKEGKGTVKIYYNIGEEADFTKHRKKC